MPAGQTGLYSISLQSLTNVDTPYVFFTFGAPQLLQNPKVFGLPYTAFNSNVRGEPDGQRTDVPWASLDSEVNTTGLMLAPGYAFDVSAGGYVGLSFSVHVVPGPQGDLGSRLRGVPQRDLRRAPDLAALARLDDINHLPQRADGDFTDPDSESWTTASRSTSRSASTIFRRRDAHDARRVRRQGAEAERLRTAILADPKANAALVNLAADAQTWRLAYLAALEESGCCAPDDEAPPIRLNPKVISTLGVLASGILVGPGDTGDPPVEPDARSSPRCTSGTASAAHHGRPRRLRPALRDGCCPSTTCRSPRCRPWSNSTWAEPHPYFQAFNIFSPWMGGSRLRRAARLSPRSPPQPLTARPAGAVRGRRSERHVGVDERAEGVGSSS